MHRNEWRFAFPVPVVRMAAGDRWEYHDGREKFWQAALDQAEAEMRAAGVQFRDVPVTGGRRMDAVIDHQMSERVYECRDKLEKHRHSIRRYRAIMSGLGQLRDDATVALDLDDIEFLGINGTATQED